MFTDQKIDILADSLENLTKIVIALKSAGIDYKEDGEDNEYMLAVNHDELKARLHLFKINTENDITTESKIND